MDVDDNLISTFRNFSTIENPLNKSSNLIIYMKFSLFSEDDEVPSIYDPKIKRFTNLNCNKSKNVVSKLKKHNKKETFFGINNKFFSIVRLVPDPSSNSFDFVLEPILPNMLYKKFLVMDETLVFDQENKLIFYKLENI
jgi:hypothetical protein